MTQKIYDNQDFFDNYSKLNRSLNGLDGAAEWESVQAVLPDLSGKRVVDLGCGYGWFARYAIDQGAKSVLGLDISKKMIAQAEKKNSDRAITYEVVDLEDVQLPKSTFDFAYSSLAIHYIRNFKTLSEPFTKHWFLDQILSSL